MEKTEKYVIIFRDEESVCSPDFISRFQRNRGLSIAKQSEQNRESSILLITLRVNQIGTMSVMKVSTKKKSVYVAMSGGVDSSVAAALLKKRGFDVVGVFMKPWQPAEDSFCLWKEDREDAMRAASVLGIPLLTWDFSKQYKKSVTDYMLKEYKAGRTPNPDVMCNKEIKFGLFFKKARKEGADFIATGHYARIAQVKSEKLKVKSYKLLMAKDKNKDQSYFLWTLKQQHLSRCLFPVGEYIKPEVRRLAKKFGLPNHAKKDSQGVCFIGPLDMKDFLKTRIKPKPGRIMDSVGRQVGIHDGIWYYTIGQRHGLNIKNGQGPYYIARKDIRKNVLYVSGAQQITNHKTQITKVNWIGEKLKLPAKVNVKIRYRSVTIPAILTKQNSTYCATALPRYKLQAITPGQSAVFYKEGELLGGGVIM